VAPNIVMVVLDDLGFADLGCFGSGVATPTIDALAGAGLTYTNFHVTPLCSPTRASLLTGRNHHAVGMGMLSDAPQDAPGYTGRIPRSAATVARHLRDHGYGTFAVGKWHLAPRGESGDGGPFTHWPLQMGFERFYGFMRGLTDQWFPHLVRDNSAVDQPSDPADGYHLTDDLVTQSIEMLTTHRAARGSDPFFLYLAPGAVHSPHQAPREHIAAYRGAFDHGWDVERRLRHERQVELGIVPAGTVNTPRPPSVPAWDDLDDDAREVFARQMEVYAGFLSHTDEQLGRLLEHLWLSEELDDTIVLVTSDNGPAHHPSRAGTWSKFEPNDVPTMQAHLDEFGGVGTHHHYARGWTWAGSTPFQYWKGYSWLGGVRTPLVVRGPERPEGPGIRRQFVHAVDIMPTLLELAGVEPSPEVDGVEQQPIDGRSMLATVSSAEAPSPRSTQYFEMLGSRAIYHDGWKATTDHLPYPEMWEPPMEGSVDFERDRWSLYDLGSDFSEAVDRADQEPERLRRMVELWESEAERNHVLPMYDTPDRPSAAPPAPPDAGGRRLFFASDRAFSTPDLLAGDFDLTVELEASASASGVLLAHHPQPYTFSVRPVWALHLEQGVLVLTWGLHGEQQARVPGTLAPCAHTVEVRHRLLTGATSRVQLVVDGVVGGDLGVSREGVPRVHDLYVGRGAGIAWDGYDPRARLTGSIRRVVLETDGLEPVR
jgi:arylsulfatase A-like enzyme